MKKFWDNVKKFTHPYAEDDYEEYEDEYDGYEDEAPSANTASTAPDNSSFSFNAAPSEPAAKTGSFNGRVVNMSSGKQDVVVFRPKSFDEIVTASNDLRSRKALIVNLEGVDKALARRVVDFLYGCTHTLDGEVTKVAMSAYMFTPSNMQVDDRLVKEQSESESYV